LSIRSAVLARAGDRPSAPPIGISKDWVALRCHVDQRFELSIEIHQLLLKRASVFRDFFAPPLPCVAKHLLGQCDRVLRRHQRLQGALYTLLQNCSLD